MQLARSEAEIFSDLAALCATSGYIHVLACLSFRDNYITYDNELTVEDMHASYAPQRLLRTELATLVGLMLRHRLDYMLPEPAVMQHLIDATTKLLGELRSCLRQPMFDAVMAKELESGQSPFGQGILLREPIFYGGESAYNFQYREFAVQRYLKDDAWLLTNKGFRIPDAREVLEAISRIHARKFPATFAAMREQAPSEWTLLLGFTFSMDEITVETCLSHETCTAVLSAFSVPTTPANEGFTSLGEFNIASALPILPVKLGEFVCLDTYGAVESLYESPHYWMAADPAYRETASRHRGEFTEVVVAGRLADVFGASRVFRNVEIFKRKNRVGEVDVLVLFANRAIVVQCKSKKLTLAARKGNDLKLREDFKEAVQKSYRQGLDCATALNETGLRFICAGRDDLVIPDFSKIYIICAVSDHYPALACRGFAKLEPILVNPIKSER